MTDITFSIGSYDKDGDLFESGIYLHFGGVRIRVADDLQSLKKFQGNINDIVAEISENY